MLGLNKGKSMKKVRPAFLLFLSIALCFSLPLSVFSAEEQSQKADFALESQTAAELASKVDQLVTTLFFDKSAVEKIWRPAFDSAKQELISTNKLIDFSAKINAVLAKLHTSHTQFLTENDETFFFLRSMFGAFNKDPKEREKTEADFTGLGIGGAHAKADQVRYVLDASPAFVAGIKRGDKIRSVNEHPYTGYAVWAKTSGQLCTVKLERQGKPLELKIAPIKQDFLKGYVTATERSAKVITQAGKKIGYLHYWSGGEGARDAMESAICGLLKNTDALVLDLRDGYGGASPSDQDLFFRPPAAFPDMQTQDRQQGVKVERSYYNKPLAVLINRGVRSGKELIAYGLKQSHRAKLFGDTTAGYVVAGQYNPLDKRCFLYLGVVDIRLNGERLEGKGVAPDVPVEDKLGVDDPVLKKALEYLSKK